MRKGRQIGLHYLGDDKKLGIQVNLTENDWKIGKFSELFLDLRLLKVI